MRREIGKSISLLSTMLLATNVPAKRNKSETFLSYSCVSDFTSIGAGKSTLSGSQTIQ